MRGGRRGPAARAPSRGFAPAEPCSPSPRTGRRTPGSRAPGAAASRRRPARARGARFAGARTRSIRRGRCGPARPEVHDVGHGTVEEVTVVGDEEGRAVAAHEPLLEPHHRVEIEVVGRLVEEQQVGAAHQGLREVEPDPPATREVRHRTGEVVGVEPEAVQDPPCPRLCGVPVEGLELRVERGEPPVVAVGGGRLEAALHRAERGGRRPSSSRGRSPDSPPSPGPGGRWSSSAGPGPRPPPQAGGPRRRRKRLVLPTPFRPTTPARWPACTVRSSPVKRAAAPRLRVTFESWIIGGLASGRRIVAGRRGAGRRRRRRRLGDTAYAEVARRAPDRRAARAAVRRSTGRARAEGSGAGAPGRPVRRRRGPGVPPPRSPRDPARSGSSRRRS